MKSLSIFILLGTLTALIIGAFFAVRPASAEITQINEPAQPAAAEPVTPLTGEVAAETVVLEASNETDAPAEIAAAAFAANLEKDTAGALVAQEVETDAAASFESFAASVNNGNANQITGVYVQDVLAFGVTGQNGNAAFVSNDPSVVTQFGMAAEYGSTAFLAHNYLAGAAFFNLSEGNVVTLVYGDGSTAEFQIQSIRRFQALSPDSTQSSFVDLDSDQKLSASDLFYSMYNGDNSLVLQTCIANEGISTWGRMFVIAVPLS